MGGMTRFAVVAGALVLAACNPNSNSGMKREQKIDPDAATERPVDLRPGLYGVSIGGGTMVSLASGGYEGKLCFSASDAAEFPQRPLNRIFPEWSNCSTRDNVPKGNALGGARSCEGRLPARFTYSGSHTADSFYIQGSVAQGHDETSMAMHLGSGDFTILGKRAGAC